jgi:aquaporin Z
MHQAMKYVYEFIGTLFLVLTVGLTALDPGSVGNFAPLAIGSVLAVMVFAGGHVSGAHYNPAVSLSMALRGRMSAREMCGYWLVQLAAGLVAAYLVIYFKGAHTTAQMAPFGALQMLLAEFLFTFALCFIALNVTTTRQTAGNSYFGLAIGFIVLAGAYSVGAISGGAFNPAVALGITILKLTPWEQLWIFLVGNLAGAAVAALTFRAAHPKE